MYNKFTFTKIIENKCSNVTWHLCHCINKANNTNGKLIAKKEVIYTFWTLKILLKVLVTLGKRGWLFFINIAGIV